MKRVLFFAYTPFQIIASLAIREQYYVEYAADIILSDSIQDRERIKGNIESYKLFDIVYYGNIRKFFPKQANKIKHEYNRIKASVNSNYLAEDIGLKDLRYDVFITTEINYFTESIFSLLKKNNLNVAVELMDEGYSSYTYYFREAYKPSTLKNCIKINAFRVPGTFVRRKFISKEANTIYYFAPELLCWSDIPYNIKSIDVKNSISFHRKMNLLFDYDSLQNEGIDYEFDRKYLYFEESFFWSVGNSKDINIINQIADIVGRESLAIKLHPRNEINRFEGEGFKTNKNYGVPWELIATNLDDRDDRVFLSFSSGAVLNYKFLANKSFKTILLYKCIGDGYYHVDEGVKKWFEKFKYYYGDSVFIPNTIGEMEELLHRL